MNTVIKVSKWTNSYLMQHKLKTFIVLFTSIIEPVLYMYPLFISADIVGALVEGGGFNEALSYFSILVPIALIQVVLFFLSSFLNEVLAHRMTTDMTYDLFKTLQDRSLTYHDGKDLGEIMGRATNDSRSVNMALNPGIRMILATLVIWGVATWLLWTIKPALAFIALGILFIFAILVALYARYLEPYSTLVFQELDKVSAIATDSMSGIRDIKSYVAEKFFIRKFAKQTVKQALCKEKEGIIGAWFYPDLFVRISLLIIIAYNLLLTYQGLLSFRDLVLITTALGMVMGMSGEMIWISFIMTSGYAAAKRLNEFQSESDEYFIEDGTVEFDKQTASIEFKNVTFRYRNQSIPALNDVSFKIEDNSTLAIVGGPGSGKSSLTKLLQRLYLPSEGEILIGGVPIQKFNNESLRREIATVEQEIFLFNNSILENLRFGRPNTPLEEVREVARLAQADEFINEFEDQYETIIGDQGIRLSGGQQQRLVIARALLMDPKILILDDGASALDAATEAQIQSAIKDVLQTRTSIISSHRLAIIATADNILILDKGKVQGFGSHEELILNNNYYRKLFEKHFELPEMMK
jgi:ATP-binding cassette subfamily B protein